MEMKFFLEKRGHILIDQRFREKRHIRIRSNQMVARTYLRDYIFFFFSWMHGVKFAPSIVPAKDRKKFSLLNTFCRWNGTVVANHSRVFIMAAIMFTPSLVPAGSDGLFIATALYIIQPDGRRRITLSKIRIFDSSLCCRKIKHSANNFGLT